MHVLRAPAAGIGGPSASWIAKSQVVTMDPAHQLAKGQLAALRRGGKHSASLGDSDWRDASLRTGH